MVKHIILNCKKLLQKEEAHTYLAQMLDFPDYYGNNLDALFDCLTELEECTILLEEAIILRQTEGYGKQILNVLEEAAQINPNLKLEIQENPVHDLTENV